MRSPFTLTFALLALLTACTPAPVSKPDDALCPSINGDCKSNSCIYGVCAAPVVSGYTCPADHPLYENGGCLLACGSDDGGAGAAGTCPSQLTCAWVSVGLETQTLVQACVSPGLLALQGTLCTVGQDTMCSTTSGTPAEWLGCENSVCVPSCVYSPIPDAGDDAGAGAPVGQCPPGLACTVYDDEQDTACFPTCTTTSQCASGLTCMNGVCMGPAM
jgi:hypothetical protein